MDSNSNSPLLIFIYRMCQEPFAHPSIYLLCTFWDNHVLEASKLQVGQFVYLRNLHARFIAPMDQLISVMHGSARESAPSATSQITLLEPENEALKALLL